MSILEVNNLRKSFGTAEVLKGISLHVDRGEVVSIIGSSGSGKTTLLRCCVGLEKEYEGEIHYDGTFGMVFQWRHIRG